MRGNLIFTHIGSIQRVARGTAQRKRFIKLKRAAILSQSFVRCLFARRRFLAAIRSVRAMQCFVRAHMARRLVRLKRRVRAALRLQSWARMIQPRRVHLATKLAVTLISAWFRMRQQMKVFIVMLAKYRQDQIIAEAVALAAIALSNAASASKKNKRQSPSSAFALNKTIGETHSTPPPTAASRGGSKSLPDSSMGRGNDLSREEVAALLSAEKQHGIKMALQYKVEV